MTAKFERLIRTLNLLWVLMFTAVLVSWPSSVPVRAALSACDTEVSPHVVNLSSDTGFSFGLHNGDNSDVRWVQLTRPASGSFVLESASASGWDGNVSSDTVTFANGDLPIGSSQGFFFNAMASSQPTSTENWTVQISDNPDGSNAITCGGDTSITTSSSPSQINISGVQITSIGSNNITIFWSTDVASTSQVIYGAGQDYGSASPLNSNLTTAHTVKLTGLDPNSGYHYQVTSTTPADGGTTTSDDNTFLTADYVPPPVVSNPIVVAPSISAANVPGATMKAVPTEKIPPTVSLSTDLSKPFKQSPLISGRAGDNVAVARVEYSMDGGKDWLPVDHVAPANQGSSATLADVAFTFTPVIQDDGNYQVIVRATDTSGNMAATPPATMVIDRLPPQVGETVITFGPEILSADVDGVNHLVAGGDYRFTTHTIGGAISVTLVARRSGSAKTVQSFTLTQSSDTGLWSGVLSMSQSGSFDLFADSLDGAGNRTEQRLQSIGVYPPGRVIGKSGAPLIGATVTAYYRDASSKLWSKWDGAPYGQTNPQTTHSGTYNLMLPAGDYYLETKAQGYRTYVSDSFKLDRPQSIATDVRLAGGWGMNIGGHYIGLPSWVVQPIAFTTTSSNSTPAALPATLPNFELADTAGGLTRAIDLNGRPTVVSLIDTWSPDSTDQVAALAKLQQNGDVRVVPVFTHESLALAKTFLNTGGYSLTALADPDGILTGVLGAGPGPRHYLIDRSGHIKKLMVGVLSEVTLANELGGL
jgi:hypothetical protein